ncbi:hypothetical protein [Mycobacterium haemophilum]|uniref:hypothetical protein n=1 Tax=Mycobacterium haemophilum TaxID=29311 RepID=UPI00069A731E|nr:hypothetical protein [Mycobacterium haemophilum]ALL56336.1 hypothetical protein B586_03270 [Mycobacterium haemophilum DSM 44634]MCV7341088.1 acyl esterase [Mycobacterium haemophilum DSM 44634]
MAAEPASIPDFVIPLTAPADGARPRFSICTLVTRPAEYSEMVESFVSHGFTPADCEYLCLDNSESNRFDAFRGYNLFLSEARGDFIILCHQDIVLLDDGRAELEQRLDELTAHDPKWALCGNAGGVSFNRLAVRISDRFGKNQSIGSFPAAVTALDENFIVVRREANLAMSHDLSGFHFYGADLCIVADFLGRSAWVIDFHLRHKGVGTTGASFYRHRKDVARKYRNAFRRRFVVTTVTHFFLSGSPILSRILTSRVVGIRKYSIDLAIRFYSALPDDLRYPIDSAIRWYRRRERARALAESKNTR